MDTQAPACGCTARVGSSVGSRPRLRAIVLTGLVLALAGCTTVGPDFVPPKAQVPDQWQAADGAALSRKPADQVRWWEAFDDPVLSRLVEIAYRNNYSLKAAGLKVLEARAQLGIAVGYLYPQFQQANGSVNYTSASKNAANTKAGDLEFWEYNVGASVGWELDFWGKFRRSIDSADANVLASVAGYDNAFVLLVAQVADTYVAIRTAEAQLRRNAASNAAARP
jgi:outer membrane protein TolC